MTDVLVNETNVEEPENDPKLEEDAEKENV